MKNNIKLLAIIMVLFLTSCGEEFLQKEPLLDQSYELTLSNFSGLEQATMGVYSPLYNADWYGAEFIIAADLKAGNAKSSPLNSGRYQTDFNLNLDPANTSGLWNNAYQAITYACNVINAIDEYDPTTELEVTQEMVDHLKAECLFVRALGHFDLARTYAQPYNHDPNGLGVPVVLVTEIAEPARNTVKEVYDQVVADLKEAIGLYSDSYSHESGADPSAFSSKAAAQALLARVSLYMNNYADAITYSTAVIESGAYTLYTTDEFPAVWGTDAAPEVIFEVYGSVLQSNNPYWEEVGYIFDPDGSYGDVCATNQLLGMYDAGDVRASVFKQNSAGNYPDFWWPNKYPGKGGDTRQNNIPVLRLAEQYLIRAEANLMSGNNAAALADYNAILAARGVATAVSVTETDLFNERRKELCFEGHLLFDYARLKKSIDRVDEDNRISGTEDIPFPSNLFAAPIPIGEMEANKNMVQNDGY